MAHEKIMVEIPARGGSKGVPRKALQMLGGSPLISYTIRDARHIKGVTKVYVNTDDPEIRAVSIEHGAEVPFLRPSELARDDSPLEESHAYALDWYRTNENWVPDVMIIMSPTHPFRRRNLINQALKIGADDPEIFNIGSVSPANVTVDNFWIKKNGRFQRLRLPLAGGMNPPTLYQSAFSFNIVYGCRSGLPNRRIPVVLNDIEAIDIDEPRDLAVARRVIAEGLYPFDRAI